MVWSQYDLASDASFQEFELVVCQRPLGEFDLALQRRALELFGKSLCNFGILQIEGPSMSLSADLARNFTSILPDQGIYRRTPLSA
jgi:chemotaxis protein methyltransferase CheR